MRRKNRLKNFLFLNWGMLTLWASLSLLIYAGYLSFPLFIEFYESNQTLACFFIVDAGARKQYIILTELVMAASFVYYFLKHPKKQ
jgi:hypothetical protein